MLDSLPARQRMLRVREHHQFVPTERNRLKALVRGEEGHHAEVDRAILEFRGHAS